MIKTPLSTVIGGAFWTPGATVIGGNTPTLDQQIQKLFANGEQGFAYDPNDLSTLYQDAAGAVPVTAVGQPVGLMLDKSGRNNHAFQTVSASRPILQRNATTGAYYLAFDGVDDFLRTNNIDFTATDKVSLFAGVRKLSDVSAAPVVETGINYTNPKGGFALFAPTGNGLSTYGVAVTDIAGRVSARTAEGYAAPISAILSSKADLSKEIYADGLKFRVNAVGEHSSASSEQGGSFANIPVYIGRRGGTSIPFTGHIYGLIGIGRLTTDSETITLEKAIAKNTGVTLNV